MLVALLRLFNVDPTGSHRPGLQIFAPAIEVEVVGVVVVAIATGIGAVEANDVAVLILNPDAAGEAAVAGTRLRMDIKDQRAHRT